MGLRLSAAQPARNARRAATPKAAKVVRTSKKTPVRSSASLPTPPASARR
ncbi:MAG: hypothetical protein P1V36_02950 [Planctomycetota bacterium]|nr:hypothetical protein [Planctomycetota bacterium]